MDPNKNYILTVFPIRMITPDQCKRNTLCTNGTTWMNGQVFEVESGEFECTDNDGNFINEVTHFAVLPKGE